MRTFTFTGSLAVLLLSSVSPLAEAQLAPAGAAAATPPVVFKGRYRFDTIFDRVLKISVEPEVMPLDSASLASVVNGPAVAGAAAKEVFGLSLDDYTTYIRIKASTSAKPGAVIARLECVIKADGRVPNALCNKFVDAMRKRLQVVLEESVNLDRRNIEKRQDALLERQNYLEKKYVEVWSNRVKVAEDAGLAERSVEGQRGSISDAEEKLQDIELELLVRQSRLDFTKKEMEERSPGSPRATDPLADELEKLVRVRARQVEATNNPGATEDERDAAEARMLDSKLRWLERLEELEKLTPEQRVKALTQEIAELETRKSFYTKALAESIEKTRALFRYSEHVTLLTKKEARLDKAIERIEEQVDELANYSEKLGTITVSIIGQEELERLDSKPAPQAPPQPK